MLTTEQQSQIKNILEHHGALIATLPKPHDYPTLKKHVMILELREAWSELNTLLATPETFSRAFQSHCRERAIRNQNTLLDFSVTPDSLANQLYWEITRIVLPSTKLKNMIQFLLPQISSVINLKLPDSLPSNLTIKELKQAMKAIVPKPVLNPLTESNDDIPSNGLVDFVISNQMIFDARELPKFPGPK